MKIFVLLSALCCLGAVHGATVADCNFGVRAGSECCAGSVAGDRCDYGAGFRYGYCKSQGGKLMCTACGRDTQPCCPLKSYAGAEAPCDTYIKSYGFEFDCKAPSAGAPSVCVACGSRGKPCCAGDTLGSTLGCSSRGGPAVCTAKAGAPNQCVPCGDSGMPPCPPACSEVWQQCGGKSWTGPSCCAVGSTCSKVNDWYSQCKPSSTVPPSDGCAAVWGQCGGKTWTGPTCCTAGNKCVPEVNNGVLNEYYSQCKPSSGSPPVVTPPVDGCAALWGQCGGKGWTGAKCCSSGKCTPQVLNGAVNEYYSQCVP